MEGNLIVVAGPSGAGKTSLVDALVARDQQVKVSVSHTTRPPRPGERDGDDYHFISPAAFARMRERDAFLECAEVHGHQYGTSREWVSTERMRGLDVVLEIDCQGASQIKEKHAEAVSVFILPPSLEALTARLNTRGQDSPEVIAKRLAAAQSEMRQVANFDYVIINEDFERAARELFCVVKTARLATAQQLHRHSDLIKHLQG